VKKKKKKDISTIIGYDGNKNIFDIALSIEISNEVVYKLEKSKKSTSSTS
jgi:hypothetical protein